MKEITLSDDAFADVDDADQQSAAEPTLPQRPDPFVEDGQVVRFEGRQ